MRLIRLVLLSATCISCGDDTVDTREIGIHDTFPYTRHEFHLEPEQVTGTLLSFVYDIPYFGGCGVFPPLPIANQWLSTGGGDGGMSPGASWQPFLLDEDTYEALLDQVRNTDPRSLKGRSRYYHVKFTEDHAFDAINDRFAWAKAVCDKHRDGYLEQNARIENP